MDSYGAVVSEVLKLKGPDILRNQRLFCACLGDLGGVDWRRETSILTRNTDEQTLRILHNAITNNDESFEDAQKRLVAVFSYDMGLAEATAHYLAHELIYGACLYSGHSVAPGQVVSAIPSDQAFAISALIDTCGDDAPHEPEATDANKGEIRVLGRNADTSSSGNHYVIVIETAIEHVTEAALELGGRLGIHEAVMARVISSLPGVFLDTENVGLCKDLVAMLGRRGIAYRMEELAESGFVVEDGRLVQCPRDACIISVPEAVTAIGRGLLRRNNVVRAIVLPNTLETIGGSSFSGCTALEYISLPERLTTIEEKAFYNCKMLDNVTLPAAVTHIGPSAFSGCASLTSIDLPKKLDLIDEGLFFGCTKLARVIIPDGVTEVRRNAFCGCSALRSIMIPASVAEIGISAFSRCSALEHVDISKATKKVRHGAFGQCPKLNKQKLPPHLKGNYKNILDVPMFGSSQ